MNGGNVIGEDFVHVLGHDVSIPDFIDIIAWDAAVWTLELLGLLQTHPPIIGSELPHMPTNLGPELQRLYITVYVDMLCSIMEEYREQHQLWAPGIVSNAA